MDISILREYAEQSKRSAISLLPQEGQKASLTRIGGQPMLPKDFSYPLYWERPLSFLMQIDCAEIHALDKENLLPDRGLLSFFYDLCMKPTSQLSPNPADCLRVYWFEDAAALQEADYPENYEWQSWLPEIAVQADCFTDYPYGIEEDVGDRFMESLPDSGTDDVYEAWYQAREALWDAWCTVKSELGAEKPRIQLLGYDDMHGEPLQQCELIFRGHTYANGIPEEAREEARRHEEDWMLLLQMDDPCASSNDLRDPPRPRPDIRWEPDSSKRFRFFIRKEDLAARRFDRMQILW